MFKSLFIATAILAATAAGAHAQDSLANASRASGESVVSTARLSEAGVKVVAGAVALPFVAVGSVVEGAGHLVRESGEAVWNDANGPLEISPETVTAQPAPQVPYDANRRRDDTSADNGN